MNVVFMFVLAACVTLSFAEDPTLVYKNSFDSTEAPADCQMKEQCRIFNRRAFIDTRFEGMIARVGLTNKPVTPFS